MSKDKTLLANLQIPKTVVDKEKASDKQDAPGSQTGNSSRTGRSVKGGTIDSIHNQKAGFKATAERYRKDIEERESTGRAEVAIPIDKIDRPKHLMRRPHYWKTDRYFEIKDSIYQHGQHDPIVVRPSSEEGRYILVKGDTRLTSHADLLSETEDPAWSHIRARVEQLGRRDAYRAMHIENNDREDVAPYYYSVWIAGITDDEFNGDRKDVMEFLGLNKGVLSRHLAIARIPEALMDAYPILYDAGHIPLYNFAKAIEANPEQLAGLYERVDELTDSTPKGQITRLNNALEQVEESRKSPPLQSVASSNGKVLAEVKVTKNHVNMKIDARSMPGFAEMVQDNLESLYQQWLAQQSEPNDQN